MVRLLLLASALLTSPLLGQVLVTSNGGPPSFYVTLAEAFAVINAGVHTGSIDINIVNDTTEPATGAVLNASGTGSASYTDIRVTPIGQRTISGAANPGTALIHLNGADGVAFNGLNTGGNSLTIANTTVSNTSGSCTVRFENGATLNSISACNLQGSTTGAAGAATVTGTVVFAGDSATGNGNNRNSIFDCNFGPAGSNRPSKAIHSAGSTSSQSAGNSRNSVRACRFADTFAGNVASAAIYLGVGTNDWLIRENRIFQTGVRIFTTANVRHAGIWVDDATAGTGNQGHTISDNTIGYASADETGFYELSGSSGKFAGILINAASGGETSILDSNKVASVRNTGGTATGTGLNSPFAGILITSGRVETYANTIGSQSDQDSLLFVSTGTAATEVYGIGNLGSDPWIANANRVGGITAGISSATSNACLIYALRAATLDSATFTADGNIIGGTVADSIRNQHTNAAAASQVLGLVSTGPVATIINNLVRNLTASNGVGTNAGASVVGLGITGGTGIDGPHLLRQNVVTALRNSNTTLAVQIHGVLFQGGSNDGKTNTALANTISDLRIVSSNAAAAVHGLTVLGGGTFGSNNLVAQTVVSALTGTQPGVTLNGLANRGGFTTFQNNVVQLGSDAAGADLTAGLAINGISATAGVGAFHHNTIRVHGLGVLGSANTHALFSSVTTARPHLNNIFQNTRSNAGGTGTHYAIRVAGSGQNPSGLTLNYNCYSSTGTGGVLALYNGSNVVDLSGLQGAIGQDANSLVADPLLVSKTDARQTAASPTRGLAIEVTPAVVIDFLFKGRPGGDLSKDIGAEENDGTPPPAIDFAATDVLLPAARSTRGLNKPFTPQASFRNNGTAAQTNVTVRFQIRDAGLAVVYDQTTVIPALVFNSTATATFPTATLSAAGTYSTLARAELPGDEVAGNDQVVSTFFVRAPMSGTYFVGENGVFPNFTNFTNGDGAFQALNEAGQDDVVDLQVLNSNSESGSVSLLQNQLAVYISGFGPSPYSISGTSPINTALLRFDGNDVTINGAPGQTAGDVVGGEAALRGLTITNHQIGATTAVIQFGSTVARSGNSVRNAVIIGGGTGFGVSFGGTTPGQPGTQNNARVENCAFQRVNTGIFAAGASTSVLNTGNLFTKNHLASTGADRVNIVGIRVENQNGVEISLNEIGDLFATAFFDIIGIAAGTASVDTTGLSAGNVSNALITRNRITGVVSSSSFGNAAAGITLAIGPTGVCVVSNNMIAGVLGRPTTPRISAGIYLTGSPTSTVRVDYDSVSLTGVRNAATTMPTYGLATTYGSGAVVTHRNNIIENTQTGGTANARSYAIGQFFNGTIATSDYNCMQSPHGFRSGSLAGGAGTDYTSLSTWQGFSGLDAHSLEASPGFVSATDLRITITSPAANKGTPLGAYGFDIFGNQRSLQGPDIGANELLPSAELLSLLVDTGVLMPPFAPGTLSYSNTFANMIASFRLAATLADTNATMAIRSNNGAFVPLASGVQSGPLQLVVGPNGIEVRVTTEFGAAQSYLINALRLDNLIAPTLNISVPQGYAGSLDIVDILGYATYSKEFPPTVASAGPASLQGGTVTLQPGVSVTYQQPAPSFTGPDSYNYSLLNAFLQSATGTVNVTVVPPEYPPLAFQVTRSERGVVLLYGMGVPGVRYLVQYADTMTSGFAPLLDPMGNAYIFTAGLQGSVYVDVTYTPLNQPQGPRGFFRLVPLPD